MRKLKVILIGLLIGACDAPENHTHQQVETDVKVTDLMLSDSQVLLANIKTRKVALQKATESKVIQARLATNTKSATVVSSRVAGRIEKLFVKETGRSVKAGEPLYEIYSESLQALQHEYLILQQKLQTESQHTPYQSLAEAALKKLLLAGVRQHQLDEMLMSGKVKPTNIFYSPASGIIQLVEAAEGQYVSEGSKLYALATLSNLWVEAELFAAEGNGVKVGDQLEVLISGQPVLNAAVDFINPELKPGNQTYTMRASIANTGNLQPGMPVQVRLNQVMEGIILPVQAVIRSEKGSVVFVETEKNTFKPRVVKTGMETSTEVQIVHGLSEGEIVVASGAYLLYSEYILKHGVNPVHQH
ncbi:MAG TPA: efflux RND transporter periplasmic adaptor subunit [Cytophagales bacterium]|nr:efflux RND transporter periplasmic adaptor subunit [Cytophagales bacterium]